MFYILTFSLQGPHRTVDDRKSLARAGIAAAGPAARLGDTSQAISSVEFGGRGLGSRMHQDPHASNTGRPGRGYRLRPGLLLALEPWVRADTAELVTDADGWNCSF